ncbi:hypothetical protein CLHOM_33260 [Clostridium homopropionicum DSM 5847]|uniref:HTH-type transcriptional regulator MT1864/Rv1816-like C-terminal domain-containing protein n=1 Tax=Clostridium homopropionicum DSM 5847 TaxID=1121318 RepID=A0A0L6Z625_9CLOT|nr:TetR-like C-terminal domain-containing protein [Clostridium homopropionicum]KOA18424.1 hypothetical protein CLHOM_33260 [Clostridium homopropionicum DSM 5847]SFF67098.1 transcriptional regulator, TetR family [Clostridium homopropionicum]
MSPRIGLDLNTILKAATEIADTKGVNEITLASLAQKLEVRTPSLYNYIEGLPGLRKKLAIYGIEQLHIAITHAVIGLAGDAAVRAMSEAYLSFARLHPGLYEATFMAPDPMDLDVQKASKEVTDVVVRALKAYDLSDEEAIHVTRGLRSVLHGFASIEQMGGFRLSYDLDVSFNLLVDTFIKGIHNFKD